MIESFDDCALYVLEVFKEFNIDSKFFIYIRMTHIHSAKKHARHRNGYNEVIYWYQIKGGKCLRCSPSNIHTSLIINISLPCNKEIIYNCISDIRNAKFITPF